MLRWPVLPLVLGASLAPAQEHGFLDVVEVSRVLLDVRVVDAGGRTIHSLGVADFRVLVDGVAVALEAVEWVPAAPAVGAPQRAEPDDLAAPPIAPGRLIVILVQKDFHRSRLDGLMRVKRRAAALLRRLPPSDRVAVVSMDSRLRLWLDFTGDRAAAAEVIERSIILETPSPVAPGPFPSLGLHWDERAARDAACPESALRVLGDALKPLPGPKTVLFLGWGLGRLSYPQVVMTREWPGALAALTAARVTVFVLDITDADFHSLEVGLMTLAEETGGCYARTHLFPDLAMQRVEGALAGHYVLVFERPARPAGRHQVRVELVGRRGTVMARPFYEDQPAR